MDEEQLQVRVQNISTHSFQKAGYPPFFFSVERDGARGDSLRCDRTNIETCCEHGAAMGDGPAGRAAPRTWSGSPVSGSARPLLAPAVRPLGRAFDWASSAALGAAMGGRPEAADGARPGTNAGPQVVFC